MVFFPCGSCIAARTTVRGDFYSDPLQYTCRGVDGETSDTGLCTLYAPLSALTVSFYVPFLGASSFFSSRLFIFFSCPSSSSLPLQSLASFATSTSIYPPPARSVFQHHHFTPPRLSPTLPQHLIDLHSTAHAPCFFSALMCSVCNVG